MNWIEGVTILVANLIVVLLGSWNHWKEEKQFKVPYEKREDLVKVIRIAESGLSTYMTLSWVMLCYSSQARLFPAMALSSHSGRCDESGAMGESDVIKQLSYHGCTTLRER